MSAIIPRIAPCSRILIVKARVSTLHKPGTPFASNNSLNVFAERQFDGTSQYSLTIKADADGENDSKS